MDNNDILREEVARGIEANRTKTLLQMYFEQRREALQAGVIDCKPDELWRIQAALIELNNLEVFLNETEAGGRMASHQLEREHPVN